MGSGESGMGKAASLAFHCCEPGTGNGERGIGNGKKPHRGFSLTQHQIVNAVSDAQEANSDRAPAFPIPDSPLPIPGYFGCLTGITIRKLEPSPTVLVTSMRPWCLLMMP